MAPFDEMGITLTKTRPLYRQVARWLKETPPELIVRNPFYWLEMIGQRAPHDVWAHIAGIDIVRVDDEEFYVLEDNAPTPSATASRRSTTIPIRCPLSPQRRQGESRDRHPRRASRRAEPGVSRDSSGEA